MFGPNNKKRKQILFFQFELQLVLCSMTAAFLPSQIQPIVWSSLNQAIGDRVEMDTEESNRNLQQTHNEDDQPLLSGDVDFPFKENVA